MQHSCCWLVIPGLCNEVSHDESQNGWQKTLAGISSTSCNTCLQICNFAALWLLAKPGWPFQGSAMRFHMAEARMDGKKTLQAHPATSCCRSAICSILAAGWPFLVSAMRFHMAEARMDGKRPLQAYPSLPATSCCRSAICSILAAGWPFQGSAVRFHMAEARMDGKRPL